MGSSSCCCCCCCCCFEAYKPVLAMVIVQFIFAFMALAAKAAFSEGMSPMVFVVYRQTIASVVLVLSILLTKGGKRNLRRMSLDMGGFCVVVLEALIGGTFCLYFYYMGLRLTSSSMATAMANLIPVITFFMALCARSEQVRCNIKGIAKVLGTFIASGGAFCLTFFKGPLILSMDLQSLISLSSLATSKSWVVGSLLLVASSCCWAISLILQETICKHYLDPLALTIWLCLLSALMSALFTLFFEPDLSTWKITTPLQLFSCSLVGIGGSCVCYYLQSWSISVRGPLFAATFHPLTNIITTVLSVIIVHEKLYVGSLIGAAAILSGVYIVLWGKSEDLKYRAESLQEEEDAEEATIPINARHATVLAQLESDVIRPLIDETSNK